MAKSTKMIKWFEQPEDHNYPAAESYLSLIFDKNEVDRIIRKLRDEKIVTFKAKDIFRASRLSLLGISNSHVEKTHEKIEKGKSLSPLLLVRDTKKRQVIIADGYHRMCGVYHYDEDIDIPCKITSI
ncbi:MAG: hypothetical protein HPY57_15425 [Ignavibacteria bacterium]|nr:hypothetical protein [Ignavibacteria bacterium]